MMKKVLMIGLAVAFIFIGTNALADEPICGDMLVNHIRLYESDANDVPTAPCDVQFTFTTDQGQGPYQLAGTAFGTQLNLALLKAQNGNYNFWGCVFLIPNADFSAFDLRIYSMAEELERWQPDPVIP
jgi:hypothetical protein